MLEGKCVNCGNVGSLHPVNGTPDSPFACWNCCVDTWGYDPCKEEHKPTDEEFANVIAKALKMQGPIVGELNIAKMKSPGTVIWTDPTSDEIRFTAPGERLYSVALMFANGIVQSDGTIQDMSE